MVFVGLRLKFWRIFMESNPRQKLCLFSSHRCFELACDAYDPITNSVVLYRYFRGGNKFTPKKPVSGSGS